MSSIPEILDQASRCGLVTHREVLDGSVGVREESRSNEVYAIMVHGRPVAYVKQRGRAARLDGTDVIARERRALLTLTERECAPRVMPGAPSDSLWISVVSGSQLSGQRGNVPELAGICQTWGAAVARLHTTPVRGCTLVAPRPWVLNPRHLAPSMRGAARGSAYAAVLTAIEESESLRAATEEVAERWSERTWIHGDLSPTNVLIERRPALGVRFVDLEDAGLGDPAWDLASAIDTIDWLAPAWQSPADPLIAYFLQGYRRAGGPGRLYPAMQAVRAVATAWQVAGGADGFGAEAGSPSVRRWLDRATAHARRAASGLQAVA